MRDGDLVFWNKRNETLRILDLANGQLRPQYQLLRSTKHLVCGVDKANYPKRNWIHYAYRIARWLYARPLGHSNSVCGEKLICADVAALPFPDQAFDLVTSVAAFEHFLDVPAVVRELHRILRPNGVVWVLVHLFSSLSGGHTLRYRRSPYGNFRVGLSLGTICESGVFRFMCHSMNGAGTATTQSFKSIFK
jgi:SAM-dependent methyltransferase